MRMQEWIRSALALALLVSVTLASGCALGPRVTEPMRAIWVTRFDYTTAEDVKRIVQNCADAGFNALLFQVRGNGTAFYDSSFEPWADELGGSDPGFDPLALACDEAHARGVELHAYVNVMPAWRGKQPPDNPEQLYNKRPEWFWYDQNGDRQALSSFYVSLNPCLPEVRTYLVDVFRDLVSRYDVDGLHLDYIRFPNEPPATPRGSGLDYPRDEQTLALYKADTGLAPDDDPEAWNRWRTDQVTQLVADIHGMLRRTRPSAALSAAIGSVRERALHHFQDGRQWIADGVIDIVILMNYTDSPTEFGQRIDPWVADGSPVPIVPGLWFGRHPDTPLREAVAMVGEQVDIAREKTGNFCVFAYSSLFDSADEELTSQNERQRNTRAVRREILLPRLKALVEAS
ncbi:MAG: family 10 glycosylhydrolase [Planctomycetes bacterium]|nr:family 10 glycosylhydrolase [Planctomycetota bacterium]